MVLEDLKNADETYSEEAFKLITEMLEVEPSKRPTANAVLKSPIFVHVSDSSIKKPSLEYSVSII